MLQNISLSALHDALHVRYGGNVYCMCGDIMQHVAQYIEQLLLFRGLHKYRIIRWYTQRHRPRATLGRNRRDTDGQSPTHFLSAMVGQHTHVVQWGRQWTIGGCPNRHPRDVR